MSQPSAPLLTPPRPAQHSRVVPPGSAPVHTYPWLRELTHYQAGYAYCPERHEYTEVHTSDPHYVIPDLKIMSPSREHGNTLDQCSNALKILKPPATSDVHISREVTIVGIPGTFFTAPRHTGNLNPDLAVWAGPPPPPPGLSYAYAVWGAPLLVLEVVSHSTQEVQDNDWHHKHYAYARMGVREYWILDEAAAVPLTGFTLDALDGTPCALSQYRRIAPDAEGGVESQVLGMWLRWQAEALECRSQPLGIWIVIEEIPIMQGRREGRREGQREGRREGRREGQREGRREGELITWGRILHRLLDASEPGAADIVLRAWTVQPPAAWPSDETLDQLETEPSAWRRLLLA